MALYNNKKTVSYEFVISNRYTKRNVHKMFS